MSDDEYDALARREEELCVAHPNLMKVLEVETGLGRGATRYGGRVGRSYAGGGGDDDDYDDDDDGDRQRLEEDVVGSIGDEDAGGVVGGSTTTDATDATNATNKKSNEKRGRRIKRRHLPSAPMRSLDNAMDDIGVLAWLNRVRRLLLPSPSSSSSHRAVEDDGEDDGDEGGGNAATPTRTMRVMSEPKIDGLGLSLRWEGGNDNDT